MQVVMMLYYSEIKKIQIWLGTKYLHCQIYKLKKNFMYITNHIFKILFSYEVYIIKSKSLFREWKIKLIFSNDTRLSKLLLSFRRFLMQMTYHSLKKELVFKLK